MSMHLTHPQNMSKKREKVNMSDDLVKRLRSPTEHEAWLWSVPYQAADRIEKLEVEVKRLVKSRDKWGKLYNQTLEKLRLSVMSDSDYVKVIDAKNAEQADRIEKLEAALRKYADEEYNGFNADGAHARKALEEQTISDRDKFRGALMEIEALANFYTVRKNTTADAMRNIARAALAGKKKDD